MNREIKFRAWDINKEVFIPTDVWAVTTSNFSYFAVMIEDWEDYKLGEFMYPVAQTLSQFTGLKDKAGNEIFEGDVLSFITQRKHGFQEDGKKVILKPVQFGRFCYDNNVLGDFIGFHIDGSSIHYNLSFGCEIIGNIYQNPELLNQ